MRDTLDSPDGESIYLIPTLYDEEVVSAFGTPLYMEVHQNMKGVTAAAAAEAHAKDLKAKGKRGVDCQHFCVDERIGTIMRLVPAPIAEAAAHVPRELHGPVADENHEVKEGKTPHCGCTSAA